ncbi:MAG: NAD(P)/FAD-dependent oxidoreductase [Bacteroidota bacterium]|nr:NAD(P)/FAD-dependent oxidoreductase [Bacteroidota bacterium]
MEKFDIIMIGMGPAGMAVSAMGSSMGLKVLAIEKHKVGGECLNVGCIPSKALLKAAEANNTAFNLKKYGIELDIVSKYNDPMKTVREKISGINNKKFMKVFEKAELIIGKGSAEFVNAKTIKIDEKEYSGKKIFIGTGTEPFIPPIPGLKDIPKLTNVNIFEIKKMPKSLTIIGGGAIGIEMAQAFNRLGTKVNLLHMDAHLAPMGDEEAAHVLENTFIKEGIGVYNNANILKVEQRDDVIYTHTKDKIFESGQILVATGRKPVLEPLKLENAGIKYTKKGIIVDQHMRTNKKNIYAVGDCNGHNLLSHAAMHQGMLALMDAVSPFSLKRLRRDRYLVPWSIFTQPEIAQVGLTEKEAKAKGIKYEIVKKQYESYGRAVTDGNPEGFVKIIVGKRGRIYGATLVGAVASELIHEWALAIQYKKKIYDIMMVQHSFPTMSMLNKMVAEDWMMKKMESPLIKKIVRFFIC